MTDRIPELPTEPCLYMVHFGLGPFFRKSQKNCHISLLKVDQKTWDNTGEKHMIHLMGFPVVFHLSWCWIGLIIKLKLCLKKELSNSVNL